MQRTAVAAAVLVVTVVSALTPLRDSAPRAQTTDERATQPQEQTEQPNPAELDQLIVRLETALEQIDAVVAATERRSTDLLEKSASAASIEESGRYQQLYTETILKLDELANLQREFEVELNRLKLARQTIGKSKPR